ncbi:MAG: Rne/Rng family ribonuclease [Candidatus Omnitrophica bacterium]|nr:Rne/Rng family ribonuclease [Candidatus Omnitrophota bacterium]
MSKEILIAVDHGEKRVAVLENGRLEEFYAERSEGQRLVGNVYKGVVDSVVPGIQAAFISLGLEKNGFLYVSDVVGALNEYEDDVLWDYQGRKQNDRRKSEQRIENLLKKGQEVLIQVVKTAIGTKGARLTTHLTLPGRFLVMMPFDDHKGVSKRIPDDRERQRLRGILESIRTPEGIGLIVRTAAAGCSEKDMVRDAKYLLGLWKNIKKQATRAPAPSLIHNELDVVKRTMRDSLTDAVDRVLVDNKEEHREILSFMRPLMPDLRNRVHFYGDSVQLLEKAGVEEQIQHLYDREVKLPSGGTVVIEQTESLVAIDVNSAKFTGRKNLEDTAFVTNKEAARELPRQIRLRDLGGIIIIDFIDMEEAAHRREVLSELQRAMADDRARTNILSISELGLVEMTRQRMRKSVEGVALKECPYCAGRGVVKSASTVAIQTLRKLRSHLQKTRARQLTVAVHPEVAASLMENGRRYVNQVERTFRARIDLRADIALHIEDVNILN